MLKKIIITFKTTPSVLLSLFLLFVFLVSKELLILNEEFLILIAFIGTTYFLYNLFKQSLPEALDLRANQIEDSLKQAMASEYSSLIQSKESLKETESHINAFKVNVEELSTFSKQLILLNTFSINFEIYKTLISSLQEISKELRKVDRIKNAFLKTYIINKLRTDTIATKVVAQDIISKCLNSQKRALIIKKI